MWPASWGWFACSSIMCSSPTFHARNLQIPWRNSLQTSEICSIDVSVLTTCLTVLQNLTMEFNLKQFVGGTVLDGLCGSEWPRGMDLVYLLPHACRILSTPVPTWMSYWQYICGHVPVVLLVHLQAHACRIERGQAIVLISKRSRPVLGPTQPLI
jgi:hypothetical protein